MKKRFNETLNTAVFTTRFVFIDKKPILSVFHHEDDGMWEFIGDDECANDNDYLVVSLEEVIELDESIVEVSDLPIGGVAYRTGRRQPWIIQ